MSNVLPPFCKAESTRSANSFPTSVDEARRFRTQYAALLSINSMIRLRRYSCVIFFNHEGRGQQLFDEDACLQAAFSFPPFSSSPRDLGPHRAV